MVGGCGPFLRMLFVGSEPAEIEAAVKQVLGIDWAAAKGFEDGNKSYLCAYYTADVQVDPEHMREELMKRLRPSPPSICSIPSSACSSPWAS